MVKLRLQRVGRRNDPSFRIVAQDSRVAPDSKVLEILGFYNPRLKQKGLKKDRIEYWLAHGAQTSGTVHNLLVSEGIIAGPKRNVVRRTKAKLKAQAPPAKEPEQSPPAKESPPDEKQEKEQAGKPASIDKQAKSQ